MLFLVESLAGRYRDPVLILPLIVEEHSGLRNNSRIVENRRVECLAGRYRDPVLILPLIVDEHTGLNHCSLLARVDTPDFVVIMAFCALAVKLSYSQQGVY